MRPTLWTSVAHIARQFGHALIWEITVKSYSHWYTFNLGILTQMAVNAVILSRKTVKCDPIGSVLVTANVVMKLFQFGQHDNVGNVASLGTTVSNTNLGTAHLGNTQLGQHTTWATCNLGNTQFGQHAIWATRNLGNTQFAIWATTQFGHSTAHTPIWATNQFGQNYNLVILYPIWSYCLNV